MKEPSSSRKRCLKKLLTDLRTLTPQALSVLDVGCGWGTGFLRMGKKQYSEIVGIEPNEVQATQARNPVGVKVYNEPYSDECFAENRFDVITFIQVMEHLPDPLAAMRAAHIHLKPGGVLADEVPSFNNPRVLLYRLTRISWFARSDFIPTHISYFTANTLSTCVALSGFVIKEIQTGNYAAKMGLGRRIGWFVDFISNYFRIGGITLFAIKRCA